MLHVAVEGSCGSLHLRFMDAAHQASLKAPILTEVQHLWARESLSERLERVRGSEMTPRARSASSSGPHCEGEGAPGSVTQYLQSRLKAGTLSGGGQTWPCAVFWTVLRVEEVDRRRGECIGELIDRHGFYLPAEHAEPATRFWDEFAARLGERLDGCVDV